MIDYQKIQDSINYYEERGFQRIESPWWVSRKIHDITKPEGVSSKFLLKDSYKELVASGEQSFLYLMNKGYLPKGRYQTTTPCFRDESIGGLHYKAFIKNELICTEDVNYHHLIRMINTAQTFFKKYSNNVEIVTELHHKSIFGYDILVNGIEVGSYGIREFNELKWIYGTGCAEPRLSKALNY